MFARFRAAIAAFYGRTRPADDRLWHRWSVFFFSVRLTNGKRSMPFGQIWRRRGPNGWEYRQDEETKEEWEDRQW